MSHPGTAFWKFYLCVLTGLSAIHSGEGLEDCVSWLPAKCKWWPILHERCRRCSVAGIHTSTCNNPDTSCSSFFCANIKKYTGIFHRVITSTGVGYVKPNLCKTTIASYGARGCLAWYAEDIIPNGIFEFAARNFQLRNAGSSNYRNDDFSIKKCYSFSSVFLQCSFW